MYVYTYVHTYILNTKSSGCVHDNNNMLPDKLCFSKECMCMVVERVQNVSGNLESGTKHYHHIGKSHLIRL